MVVRMESIVFKLFGLVALIAVGLLAVSLLAAYFIRDGMLNAKIDNTRSQVEIARSVAQTFHDRAMAGEFDEATARDLARAVIRNMRYGEGDYFFVYDRQGVSVVHGPAPEREGKSFLDTKDGDGKTYIRDMIALVENGGGHLFYSFAKPGVGGVAAKVSSVLGYAPWGWMIGTGVYIDDVDAAFWRGMGKFSGAGLLVLAAASAMALLLARAIVRPLRLLAAVTSRIGGGDYAVEVPAAERADEIGSLAKAISLLRDEARSAERLRHEREAAKGQAEAARRATLGDLADRFDVSVRGVVDSMVKAVGTNTSAAESLSGVAATARLEATSAASAVQQVNANIQTVAAATEQLSVSIAEIAGQVRQSSNVSDQAVAKAGETNQLVAGLAEAVDHINDVVGLITDIASRSNLLALNATIEAARAGEAGKGFAVVAGEVKHLANQTAKATGEIVGQLEAVRSATALAVDAIHAIAGIIDTMNRSSSTIAVAVEQQAAATKEISRNINQAAGSSQDVSEFVGKLVVVTGVVAETSGVVRDSSASLAGEAEALRGEADRFLSSVAA
jgi:methyl-accepting chemotaxis protein